MLLKARVCRRSKGMLLQNSDGCLFLVECHLLADGLVVRVLQDSPGACLHGGRGVRLREVRQKSRC